MKTTKHLSQDIHTHLYHKLFDVIPDLLTIEESGKSVVAGFMNLNLDVHYRTPERIIIALSHYYRQYGDMIPDPDMVIAVYPLEEKAEALAYQDTWGSRSVYFDNGVTVDTKTQRDLNSFLNQWLTNLIMQGHYIKAETADEG
ncbi:MAG: DUF1249 domain-containing protein [Gallionella sp.]|nr:DUF1249 domain-containing protein [Gallionella sp.]